MREAAKSSDQRRRAWAGGGREDARRDSGRDGRSETVHERWDRKLSELTGGLRVVVTGVQLLFARSRSGFSGLPRLCDAPAWTAGAAIDRLRRPRGSD